MILSDLIRLPVVAGDQRIGYVVDARFTVPSEGEKVKGDATLVGLIVSHRHSASFLGYERNSVNRPWLIADYLAWRHRGAFLLKWDDIECLGRDAVRAREEFTRHDASLD